MVNISAELIAEDERNGYHTDTVMCRGHLECQEKVCKQVIKTFQKNVRM